MFRLYLPFLLQHLFILENNIEKAEITHSENLCHINFQHRHFDKKKYLLRRVQNNNSQAMQRITMQ